MFNLGRVVTGQRSKLFVNAKGFNAMRDICNRLRNLEFDPVYFKTQSLGSGYFVTLTNVAVSGEENEFHWKVETNSSSSNSSSLIVHGGYWCRETEAGLAVNKIPLTCDTGPWDEDYTNTYKSISTSTNVGSHYIYLELDNPLEPTTCEAKSSPTWPAYNSGKSIMVIAKTNCSSGVIEQYLEGDYYDSTYARPDSQLPNQASYSIAINTAGRTILFDVENPTPAGMVTGDLVVFRQDSGIGGVPTVRYTTKVLAAGTADTAGTSGSSAYALYAGTAAFANVAGSGWPIPSHNTLSDIVANTNAQDNHNGDPVTPLGNFAYLSGRINRIGNSFAPSVSLDDATGNESILPNEHELRAADSAPTLKWSSGDCYLQIALGAKTLKWAAQELVTGNQVELNWGTHTLVNSWSSTLDFAVGRDCSSYKFEITDQPGDNYWDSDDFIVNTDATVDLYGATGMDLYSPVSVNIGIPGSAQINIGDEIINLFPSTGGTLCIEGAPGKTGWVDDGVNFRLSFTKGLITAVANTAGAGWSSD